jgi:hypothetical protein
MEFEQRLYHKFANLFELTYDQGKLYELKDPPLEEQRDAVVYYKGKHFSHKKMPGAVETELRIPILKNMFTKQFCLKLRDCGYRFRKKYHVFRNEDAIGQPNSDVFEVFNGFKFRTIELFKRLFLCIDPHLIIITRASIDFLLKEGMNSESLSGFSVRYKEEGLYYIDGFLLSTAPGKTFDNRLGSDFLCQIKSYRDFKEELVSPSVTFPESRPEVLQALLDGLGRNFNVVSLQRQHSFLNSRTASRDRLQRTLRIVTQLQDAFPLNFGKFKVVLENQPARIKW